MVYPLFNMDGADSNALELKPQLLRLVHVDGREQFWFNETRPTNWEIIAVEKGSFTYNIKGCSGEASFGDLVLCPPGALFQRRILRPLSFYYILCDWQDGKGQGMVHDEVVPRGAITMQDIGRLKSTYSHLRELVYLPDAWSSHLAEHYLYDIWCLYCQEQSRAETVPGQNDPLMQKAAQYLRQHAYGALSLHTLAQDLNLTPGRFTQRFQAAHSVTPMAYLTELRMQKAKRLLLEASMNLEEVAEACGYQSGFYLSRVFHKVTGMRPSYFRKVHHI